MARELPGIPVSVSHEVAPIWREYERTSTTIADAYLKPLMGRYVESLTAALPTPGCASPWTIMKSNGGAMRAEAAAENPIQTAQSGPAGGMLAAAALGVQAGEPNLLTLDMGGTSADVGIIPEGELKHTTEYEIEWGVPAAIPLIDIKSIGAGGGSIAWIDAGGFLRVGPESARARPGPACYGNGGTRRPSPTRISCSGASIPAISWAGGCRSIVTSPRRRSRPCRDRRGMTVHRSRVVDRRNRQREHGQRDQDGLASSAATTRVDSRSSRSVAPVRSMPRRSRGAAHSPGAGPDVSRQCLGARAC